MEGNHHLADKKTIFQNLKRYYEKQGKDPFDCLPETYVIEKGTTDP
jgi:hypothetical protein